MLATKRCRSTFCVTVRGNEASSLDLVRADVKIVKNVNDYKHLRVWWSRSESLTVVLKRSGHFEQEQVKACTEEKSGGK